MRTEAEVIKATRYVAIMADMTESDPKINEILSTEEMRTVRSSTRRIFEVLEWVLGGDNQFGRMVQRSPIPDEPDGSDAGNVFGHRRRTKPRRRRKEL